MPTPEEQSYVSCLLADLRSPCIVDLGSHKGEEEKWIRAACSWPALYVMVEADVRNAQFILEGGVSSERRVIVGAVAAHNGLIEFNVCDNATNQGRGSGSIRNPTGHLTHFDWCTFPFKTTVPCYTLDEIFRREQLTKIDLLWVDIQGAEKDMIAGGHMALSGTRYLFMEAEDVEMYKGQALKPELIAMLPGWKLLRDFGCNILLENTRL